MRGRLPVSLLVMLAASSGAAREGTRHVVTIDGVKFTPTELTAHPGDRIVWVNKDPFPHTATAADKTFDSGSIEANGTWSYTVTKKGEIGYSCTFHPTMKDKIRVQ